MSISSGSVGDIISISLIVKELVKILDGSRGSTAEYREVIRDLWELDNLLLQVELVSRTYEQTAELNALCATAKSIVQSCRECAEKFKESIKKYDSSLGMGNRRNVIVDVSMKIRWQVCHKDDLDKFRESVNAHCASLSILLSTATLSVMSLNDKKLQDQRTAAEAKNRKAADTRKSLLSEIRDRLIENTQFMRSAADRRDQSLKLRWLRKLGTEMTVIVRKTFAINFAIYRTVSEIQASLPSHLERTMWQQPFELEDAIGRVFPVHLQFICTWDSFDYVLETNFRNLQGHKKILNKDFVLQERATKRDISRDLPWERAFLPGQKIDMSMIFTDSRDDRQQCCPGCQEECSECSEAGTQCPNCGIWFGRIVELIDSEAAESPHPLTQSTDLDGHARHTTMLPETGETSHNDIPSVSSSTQPARTCATFALSKNGSSSKKMSFNERSAPGEEPSRFKRVRIIFRQMRVKKPIMKAKPNPRQLDGIKNRPAHTSAGSGHADLPETTEQTQSLIDLGSYNEPALELVPKTGARVQLVSSFPKRTDYRDKHRDEVSGEETKETDDIELLDSTLSEETVEFEAWVSLTSSVTSYEIENGRTYHAYRAGIYYLPNDDKEQKRMDLQHFGILLLLNEQLLLAPISQKQGPNKILDQGTGTGIWAIEIADNYPEAKVIGTDLSPIQPSCVPPNLYFEIDNVDADWDKAECDIVHCGLGNAFSKRRWGDYLNSAYKSLNPGGWFEVKDFDISPRSEDGSLPQDSAIVRWHDKLLEGANLGNVNLRFSATELKNHAEAAGFVNVTISEFAVPIGGWCRDPKMKRLGLYQMGVLQMGLDAFSLAIFTRLLNWSLEDIQALLIDVQIELKNRGYHWYWPFFVVYGQKPEESI